MVELVMARAKAVWLRMRGRRPVSSPTRRPASRCRRRARAYYGGLRAALYVDDLLGLGGGVGGSEDAVPEAAWGHGAEGGAIDTATVAVPGGADTVGEAVEGAEGEADGPGAEAGVDEPV